MFFFFSGSYLMFFFHHIYSSLIVSTIGQSATFSFKITCIYLIMPLLICHIAPDMFPGLSKVM